MRIKEKMRLGEGSVHSIQAFFLFSSLLSPVVGQFESRLLHSKAAH